VEEGILFLCIAGITFQPSLEILSISRNTTGKIAFLLGLAVGEKTSHVEYQNFLRNHLSLM